MAFYPSGGPYMQETANGKIHKLEVTDDTLTSRGGLAFFVKYLEAIAWALIRNDPLLPV
jgi:hypothetical protein